MQGRCHQTTSLPARCANIHIKTLVHKLVDHKLVYHLHFLGNWRGYAFQYTYLRGNRDLDTIAISLHAM